MKNTEEDMVWRKAWEEYDEGNMAVQLSYGLTSYSEIIRCVRKALAHFAVAATELDSLDDDWQSSQSWKTWREEIDTGLALTRKRLASLGVEDDISVDIARDLSEEANMQSAYECYVIP
jgi:hypothetical protein